LKNKVLLLKIVDDLTLFYLSYATIILNEL